MPSKSAQGSLQVFFDGEPSAAIHLFGVRVLESGKAAKDVWSKNDNLKGNTGGKWVTAKFDLSPWAGKSVQLQIWFDVAVAFPKEAGFGLVVDELRVEGGCP